MITLKENGTGHWVLRIAAVILAIYVIRWIPDNTDPSTMRLLAEAFALCVAGLSVNLVFGFAGQISIGHSAFFGIGGYATAILITKHGWSPGWTIYVGMLVAFLVGCLVGLPALRLKGIYLALVTLGVAVLFPQLMKWQKLAWLTNGARGINGFGYDDPPDWPFIGELKGRAGNAEFSYWLSLVVLFGVYLVVRGLVKSRVGRSLVAIRDNETAAAVMGVNLAITKTVIFGISAALCAAGGSVAALNTGVIVPEESNVYITLLGSIIFVLIMVIGGAGTIWGPILGGILYVWVSDVTREAGASGEGVLGSIVDALFGWTEQSPAAFIFAVFLIALMFVAPFGLLGFLKKLARRLVVVVPAPVGPMTTQLTDPALASDPDTHTVAAITPSPDEGGPSR
jgi:branched-chain amino acid transport system permease protein